MALTKIRTSVKFRTIGLTIAFLSSNLDKKRFLVIANAVSARPFLTPYAIIYNTLVLTATADVAGDEKTNEITVAS